MTTRESLFLWVSVMATLVMFCMAIPLTVIWTLLHFGVLS